MTTFVDLFCGAGGLSLGLERAGWTHLLAVDHWSDAITTYKQNFPTHLAIQEDVSLLNEYRLRELVGISPDWVVGGPPCQGFSTVGRRERDDPRNRLVHEFARIVEVLQPQGVLIENVVGLRDMNFVESVCELFQDIGYGVTALVLKAADYGVPQLRHRIVFVVEARAGSAWRRCPDRDRSRRSRRGTHPRAGDAGLSAGVGTHPGRAADPLRPGRIDRRG